MKLSVAAALLLLGAVSLSACALSSSDDDALDLSRPTVEAMSVAGEESGDGASVEAYCSVECGDGSTRSCTTSGSCTAVGDGCDAYVICNAKTLRCPTCECEPEIRTARCIAGLGACGACENIGHCAGEPCTRDSDCTYQIGCGQDQCLQACDCNGSCF